MDLRLGREARGDYGVAVARATGEQLLAVRAVDADDALGRVILREQTGLGLEIGLEGSMVVKMILGEVGERGDRELACPGTLQIKRMRAYFHGNHAAAGIAHLGEELLKLG